MLIQLTLNAALKDNTLNAGPPHREIIVIKFSIKIMLASIFLFLSGVFSVKELFHTNVVLFLRIKNLKKTFCWLLSEEGSWS